MKKNFLIVFIVLFFISCQKEISQEVASPTEMDVYVAGFIADGGSYSLYYPLYDEHPVYWKNGSPEQLNYDDLQLNNTGYYLKSARAFSIAVSGNNVYVGGYGIRLSPSRGNLPYGMFWKNGIPVNQDSMNIYDTYGLYSLAVSDNDIYMVGWGPGGMPATYWKNENRIALTPAYSPTTQIVRATATSIAVSGNDVYVAGYQSEQLSPMGGFSSVIATYWKNGNLVKLTDGSKDANATAIAVSGGDVYVAGLEVNGPVNTAMYWKNGNRVNLTDGSTNVEVNSIALSGTDVYVGGTQWEGNLTRDASGVEYHTPIAKYWKNGKPVKLTDGSKWAEAKSIAISGNDVYVAGFENGIAKYWKNGSPVILGDVSKYSEASSIFLVKK